MLHSHSKALAYHFSICSPGKLHCEDKVCLIPFDNSAQIYFPLALDVETSFCSRLHFKSTQAAGGKEHEMKLESRQMEKFLFWQLRRDGKGENEKLSSGKLKDFSSALDCVYPSNASMIVLNYEIFLMRQRVEDDRAADGEMTENYQTKSGLASPELVDLFRNFLMLAWHLMKLGSDLKLREQQELS